MANEKWSSFPTVTVSVAGDKLVGLHTGLNYQITSLGVPNGGTGQVTLPAYELLCGGTTATGAVQSVLPGSANQVLLSGGASALPVFSTATYPATTTINQILYSSANNTVTGLATANSAMLSTSAAGVPAWSSSMTNGQLMIGSTGGTPIPATLTAGTGISISNGANSISISTSSFSITWNGVAGTTQAAATNNGYIIQNAAQTTVTLPATAPIGSVVAVAGLGAGGWVLAANTGQTIKMAASTTSSAGSLTSAEQYDAIEAVCVTANTTWIVRSAITTGFTIA